MKIHLVAAMYADETLQREFHANPQQVMERFRLDPSEIELILSQDRARLISELEEEFGDLMSVLRDDTQFPWPMDRPPNERQP